MKATVSRAEGMHLVGTNEAGVQVHFDASPDHGGTGLGPSPMEAMLQSIAACTMMDVISILQKKRKTVSDLKVEIRGERTETHPRVFTSVHLTYVLTSPDATEADLDRSIQLSQEQYCGASNVVKRSGTEVTWDSVIHRQ